MKVCHPSKNPTSLEQLIFQLQLAFELSQIKEILSTYTDILLFLVKYSFLFEAENTEIPPVTSDPARDGGNWYRYCGNNPLSHFDPNGKMEFDVDNGVIYCDLSNREDMQITSGQYVRYENEGFSTCIAKDNESGTYLQFNNSESMVNFVEQNCYDKNYGSKIESFIDTVGSLTTLADTASIPNMSNISNSLGALSFFIDASKFKDNPTTSNLIDVGLDTVGLVGGIAGSTSVPLLSIYASCIKTEIEWWAQTMAEGTVEFNNGANEYINEKMMKEMERYE